jgi:E2 domain of amyloid precursor protein
MLTDVKATKILNTLVQYVKAEQKDRVHTINHYEHVEESDPVEAETQRAAVAAHLRGIDERVTQAIEMLSRVPKYEKKIRQQIGELRATYSVNFIPEIS